MGAVSVRRWCALAVVGGLLAACSGGGGDSARPGGGGGRASAPCADFIPIACPLQVARVAVPLQWSELVLVYSSDRSSDPADMGTGWSPSILHALEDKTLVRGDGLRRTVTPVRASGGPAAGLDLVPDVDGSLVAGFDGDGRHVATYDGLTGAPVWRFGYDDEGRLSSITDQHDRVTTVQHQTSSIAILSPDGARHDIVRNGDRMTALVVDDRRSWRFTYEKDSSLLVEARTPGGAIAKLAYQDGLLRESVDLDGYTTTWERRTDGDTVEVSATTAKRRTTWTTTQDGGSTVLSKRAADGTELTVTVAGQRREVRNPDGTTTNVDLGDDPRWGSAAPVPARIEVVYPSGRRAERTETRAATLADGGDPLSATRLERTTSGVGGNARSSYDGASRALTMTDAAGAETLQTYDDHGRVVSLGGAGHPPTGFAYAPDGRLLEISSGEGLSARSTTFERAPGRVTRTDPLGRKTTVSLDERGLPVRTVGPDGRSIATTYDDYARLTAASRPGQPALIAGRSAMGRRTALTTGTGEALTDRYDEGGLLVEEAFPTGRSASYSRGDNGRITSVDMGTGPHELAIDPTTGKLVASTGKDISSMWAYDGAHIRGLSWSGAVDGKVGIARDGVGRITAVEVGPGEPLAYRIDDLGRVVAAGAAEATWDEHLAWPEQLTTGAVTDRWEHDELGRPQRQVVEVRGAQVLSVSYDYDAGDRIVATRTIVTDIAVGTSYEYDTGGRVIAATAAGARSEFVYDARDNRVATTRPQGALALEVDAFDRLTKIGDIAVTYANGDVTAAGPSGTLTYRFDATGMLIGADLADGRRVGYVHDLDSNRVARTIDGARTDGFLYDDRGSVVAQLDAGGSVVARFAYVGGGAPVLMEKGGRTYAVVRDHLGSVIRVIDSASGEVAQAMSYDVDGNVLTDSNPGFQPFGFTGGLYDAAVGAVHLGARDYFPAIARWLAPDPIDLAGGQRNLYSYVGGDPVNRIDPSGTRHCQTRDAFALGCSRTPPPEGFHRGRWEGHIDLPDGEQDAINRCRSSGDCADATELDHRYFPNNFSPEADEWSRRFGGRGPDDPPGTNPLMLMPDGNVLPTTDDGIPILALPDPPGSVRGDVHLVSHDGRYQIFMDAGEYEAVNTDDGSFSAQIRLGYPRGTTHGVSVLHAVAVRSGTDKAGVYVNDSGVRIMVNGTPTPPGALPITLTSGMVVRAATADEVDSAEGYAIEAGGRVIAVSVNPSWAGMSIQLADTDRGQVTGMLGDFDGAPENDLRPRGGEPLTDVRGNDLYRIFGDSWRVTAASSLFDYDPGTNTSTFTPSDDPPDRAEPTAEERAKAEAICRGVGVLSEPALGACVTDLVATGDPTFALDAIALDRSTARRAADGLVDVSPGPTTTTSAPSANQTFPIDVGATVGPDVPGAGAGRRELLEPVDVYPFKAPAGTVVRVEMLSCEVDQLSVSIRDSTGRFLTSTSIRRGCTAQPPPVTLTEGGVYEVALTGTGRGTYSFRLVQG